ncbi:MAG: GAF domain-containing protein [Elusimicrobia bacterium]|nr:GAF domain-containing protein [Elusimicrobiota bacterium]
MPLGLYHYKILYEILSDINTIHDEEKIASYILSKISKDINAEGGTIFILKDDGLLWPAACYGAPIETLRKIELKIGMGAAGTAAKQRQVVRVDRLRDGPGLSADYDKITGLATRNALAAPILFGGRLEGVIEFVNKRGSPFSPADEELAGVLGQVAGSALEKARSQSDLKKSETLKQSILETLTAGIIIVDPALNILLYNKRAKEILKPCGSLFRKGAPLKAIEAFYGALVEQLRMVLDSGMAQTRQENLFGVDGMRQKIGYSCAPVTDGAGRLLGASLLFQDITHVGEAVAAPAQVKI